MEMPFNITLVSRSAEEPFPAYTKESYKRNSSVQVPSVHVGVLLEPCSPRSPTRMMLAERTILLPFSPRLELDKSSHSNAAETMINNREDRGYHHQVFQRQFESLKTSLENLFEVLDVNGDCELTKN